MRSPTHEHEYISYVGRRWGPEFTDYLPCGRHDSRQLKYVQQDMAVQLLPKMSGPQQVQLLSFSWKRQNHADNQASVSWLCTSGSPQDKRCLTAWPWSHPGRGRRGLSDSVAPFPELLSLFSSLLSLVNCDGPRRLSVLTHGQ